jgi:hypothetical protein
MKAGGDPPFSLTIVVFLIGSVVCLVILLFVQVLFFNVQRNEEQAKIYADKPRELAELQARQLGQISTYRYLDPKAGIVAIPIDRAIELYVAEVKAGVVPTTMKVSTQPSASAPTEERTP